MNTSLKIVIFITVFILLIGLAQIINAACPPECLCPDGTIGVEGGSPQGFVPCGRKADDLATDICECCRCTLCHLFILIKRLVDFTTVNIIFPLAVLMIVVGGVILLTAAGDPGRLAQGKNIIRATIIGIIIILAAWLIVNTIITFLTPADSIFHSWYTIDCPVDGPTGPICVNRGEACAADSDCCSNECSSWSGACYDSSLDGSGGANCYSSAECLSSVCEGPASPGSPGSCQ
jgi:hypothetical protein